MVTKRNSKSAGLIDDDLARREAEIFSAIGHPIRVKIVHLLAAGPASAGDIARAVGGGRSNVSRHLTVLRQAGILRDERDGLNVNYTLAIPCILEALSCSTRAVRQRLTDDAAALRKLK